MNRQRTILIGVVLVALLTVVAVVSALGFLVARQLLTTPRVALPPGADPDTTGVLVVQVLPDSPADLAGVRRGAIIFSVDGLLVRERAEISRLLENRGPGAVVTLLVLQGDEPEEISLGLAAAPPLLGAVLVGPAAAELQPPPAPPTPPIGGEGAAAEPSTRAELPVVTRVIPDSPAAAAGFRTGDVITAVGEQPVTSVAQLLTVLRALSPGQSVVFIVQRAGLAESLLVTVGERAGTPGEPFLGVQLPPNDTP